MYGRSSEEHKEVRVGVLRWDSAREFATSLVVQMCLLSTGAGGMERQLPVSCELVRVQGISEVQQGACGAVLDAQWRVCWHREPFGSDAVSGIG
jgi:hypothetical protein